MTRALPAPSSATPATELTYRALANAMPQLVWIYDQGGKLEWVNDRLIEYSGLDLQQINSGAGLALVHSEDLAAVEGKWQRALAEGSVFETEYRLRDKSGRYRWHLGRIVPYRNEQGQIINWFGTATDIDDRRRVEEHLRASERRFQAAFLGSPLPTIISRLSDGTYVDVNPAFCELTGYSRQESIGRSGTELGVWLHADRARLVELLRRDGAFEQDEVSLRTRDGRTRLVNVSSQCIDVDGVQTVLTVFRDVTEQRRALEMLRRSEAEARAHAEEVEAVLDATPAAVWIAEDPECRKVRSSKKGYELLRIPVGGQVSKTADEAPQHFRVLQHGVELRPDQLPLQRAAREGVELREFEEEIRFDDGRSVYTFGSAVPLYAADGKVRGSIAAFVDITRHKLAEAALRESDRRKDEFIAMLSHELRNPLAPIVTAVHLMKLRGDVATPHERGVIERQAAHLMRLVDDLLDVSRIARGKIELKKRPLELSRVVAHAVESVGLLFEQKRQQLSIDVPNRGLLVDADENRLVQVVANLLTNATRYTQEGGRIEVTAKRSAHEVVLRVRDNGVGIAPELLPNIFELFVQGKREGAQGGLGLGLSLVRSLLTLHGGTVEAISEGVDRGSELVVRLPASVQHQTDDAIAGPAPRADQHNSLRILVVDDNVDAAELLSLLLMQAGHEVEVAHDPAKALSLLERFEPQLAILDIGLPVMDGYRLGAELRRRLGPRSPALVALTGYGQEHDHDRTADAGFAAHLVKPVEPERLLQLVAALVTRR